MTEKKEQVDDVEVLRPVVTMDDVDHQQDVHQAVRSVSVVGEVSWSDQQLHLETSSKEDEEVRKRFT